MGHLKIWAHIIAAMLEFLQRQFGRAKAVPFWKKDGLR
jgi:hypothetical protein